VFGYVEDFILVVPKAIKKLKYSIYFMHFNIS
jgi:hypothetical protein